MFLRKLCLLQLILTLLSPFLPHSQNEISEKEKQIRDALAKLDNESSGSISADELAGLRRELSESRTLIEQHEQTINELAHTKETLERKREDLEGRLTILEVEYEELLGRWCFPY